MFRADELSDFAHLALGHAITALKFAHAQLHPNSLLPAVITPSSTDFGTKSLCYRATIRNEVEPQYWLGKHFLNKAAIFRNSSEGRYVFHEVDEELKKANYWFRLAANQGHAAALYEHGKLLIDGVEGKEYVGVGVNNLFRAANKGNSDANADVGQIYYHGAHDQPRDFVEARKHFEIAAMEDHPSALTMLGVMYLRGEGGPANPQAAFEYTKKSAEAGYPTGQMNLFVHYWNGEIAEKDLTKALVWLNKAASQNLPEALVKLADLIQAGLVPGKTLDDADGLLLRCMDSVSTESSLRSKAAFQYARLLSRHSDQIQSLTRAADILQQCYEAEKCEGELAQACVELAQSIVQQIRELIRSRRGTAEEIVFAEMITNYYFDPSGKPIPKRSVGLERQLKTMQEMRKAKRHLSPELYQRRLLEKTAPTLLVQSKQKTAPRFVSLSKYKVGRNDPCPCNSGKKFKLCCGSN